MKDNTSHTNGKPRGQLRPVPEPQWRWLFAPGRDLEDARKLSAGALEINGKSYNLEPIYDEKGGQLTQTGWRLESLQGQVYDLPIDLSACDCGDGTFRSDRPLGCKHRRALALALAALPAEQAKARQWDDEPEVGRQLAKLAQRLDADVLLEWASVTLPCAPVPCHCTDFGGPCLRCEVELIVARRQQERAPVPDEELPF